MPKNKKLTLLQAREKLNPFSEKNPVSEIDEITNNKIRKIRIKSPWGENGIAFHILPAEFEEAKKLLNNVRLPERYSAIWHADTKNLEFIYWGLPIKKMGIEGRKFDFNFRNNKYICEWKNCSERLLKIAKYAEILSPSLSDSRNLLTFKIYLEEIEKGQKLPHPISFWVNNIEWNENEVFSLINHLNFFMRYSDTETPTAQIHPPKTKTKPIQSRPRYRRDGAFPSELQAFNIDDHILNLWSASRSGDPVDKFLYSYRIVEYISTFYIKSEVKDTIRRAISVPDVSSNLRAVINDILVAVLENDLGENQKFDTLLRRAVSGKTIWKEIVRNTDFFKSPMKFEGEKGLKINNIIDAKWEEKDFLVNGMAAVCIAARDIRNSLSHGMNKTGVTITPTIENSRLLKPWADLMSVIAEEVIIYTRE